MNKTLAEIYELADDAYGKEFVSPYGIKFWVPRFATCIGPFKDDGMEIRDSHLNVVGHVSVEERKVPFRYFDCAVVTADGYEWTWDFNGVLGETFEEYLKRLCDKERTHQVAADDMLISFRIPLKAVALTVKKLAAMPESVKVLDNKEYRNLGNVEPGTPVALYFYNVYWVWYA